MKIYYFLFSAFLFFDVTLGTAQTQAALKKELGKINFGGSADEILSASVENGVYTYSLKQPGKTPDSLGFSLYSNTYQNFESNLLQKKTDISAETKQKLRQYYDFFISQDKYQFDNITGGKAMEMTFNGSVGIYSYNHPDFAQLKDEDIYFLMRELFPDTTDSSFKGKEFDYEAYNKIDSSVFSKEFETNLEKIKIIENQFIRREELYKEINRKYNSSLVDSIKDKIKAVEIEKGKNLENLKKAEQDSISQLNRLLSDSSSAASKRAIHTAAIVTLGSDIAALENKLAIPLTIRTVSDNSSIDAVIREAFQSNLDLAPTDRQTVLAPAESTPEQLNIIHKQDGIAISEYNKNKTLKEKKISEKSELEREVIQLSEELLDIRTKITRLKVDIVSSQEETAKLNQQIGEKIKENLKDLAKSNKFRFKPTSIQLEVNRGYLENIVVAGDATVFIEESLKDYAAHITSNSISLKFVNDYPIGLSAKTDIIRLRNQKLYSRQDENKLFELRLGDLISNINEILALDRTDYSPKDSAYLIDLTKVQKYDFSKPDTKEILQLKVFTDFVGINEENPNGLIQLEMDREIPLVTKRKPKQEVWWAIRGLVNKRSNLGYFNFFRPTFVLSKVEESNRYLILEPYSDSNDTDLKYASSTLELKRFEKYSIGTDLNLLLYNIPYAKSTFLLNGGIRFGRTDITTNDAIPENSELPNKHTNTIQPSTELAWRINGDERFGFEFSYGINWIFSDESNFKQISNTDDLVGKDFSKPIGSEKGLQRFTILAYLNIDQSTSGRLFFRYRHNSELGNLKNNYSQLQLGYTTALTRPNKK